MSIPSLLGFNHIDNIDNNRFGFFFFLVPKWTTDLLPVSETIWQQTVFRPEDTYCIVLRTSILEVSRFERKHSLAKIRFKPSHALQDKESIVA